jgi:hypothetical protein
VATASVKLFRLPADTESMPLPELELAFPFLFAGLWIGVCSLLGRAGGWIRLAEAYGALGLDFHGQRLRFCSGAFNRVSYNGVLSFEAGPQGLAVSVFLPFRAGHPPFSVPWSDIRFESGRKKMLPTIAMTFARCPGVRLTVRRGLAERLAEAGGRYDQIPASG